MRGMRMDVRIREIADAQHGVVGRSQLIAEGVSRASIDRRIRAGLLEPLHRGVYSVGSPNRKGAREHAASLAFDGRVFISHLSAATLHSLTPANVQPVQVIAREWDPGRKPGIRVHRFATLHDEEVTSWEGIPITTAARTLLDLAGMVTRRTGDPRKRGTILTVHDVDRAVNEAFARRLASHAALMRLLGRHLNARGARHLREILIGRKGATKSEAEKRMLALIRSAFLPEPERNAIVAGEEVDFYWPDRGVVVEVDGFAFHSTADRFERDRRRDARLAAEGLRVIRVTWRQITRESHATIARIAQALVVPSRGAEPRG